MINAFKERRWWAVALINLIFGPFIGMLSLGRGRIAFIYLVAGFVFAWIMFYSFVPFWTGDQGSLHRSMLDLPVNLIGAIHGAIIASRRPAHEPLPRYARWYSLVAISAIFPITAFMIRTFLYQPFNMSSGAMGPSLEVGDYILVSKRAFAGQSPQRGDIVVFRHDGEDYVKRIAGVAGDSIQMVHGVLVLNGKAVPRRRIEDFKPADSQQKPVRQYQETLPSGRTYRTLDRITDGAADNTPVFVVPGDHYFVLGDDRDESDDSRIEIGFVARADIAGKVVVKFADRRHSTMIFEHVE